MSHHSALRITTCGADSGSSHSANVAIMDCYKKGILRSTSLIVPAPFFEEAAEMLQAEKGLSVGLHSTINCEWNNVHWKPILSPDKVPSLVEPDGSFSRDPMAIHKRGTRFSELLAEIQAQLDLARKRGLNIRYLDTHCGFEWLFETDDKHPLADPLQQLAAREGLVWVSCSIPHFRPFPNPPAGSLPSDALAFIVEQIRTIAPGDYLLGSHPAYNDAEMYNACYGDTKPGKVAAERDLQRRFFMEPTIIAACQERRVQLLRCEDVDH